MASIFNILKSASVRLGWTGIFPKPTRKDGKPTIVVNKVDVRPIVRQSQDINKWRNALMMAEGYGQNRYMLYDLYEDILLDGFLMRACEKRIEKITNCDLKFRRKGKPDEVISNLMKRTYAEILLKEIVAAKLWGHTLLELDWPGRGMDDTIGHTHLVKRHHVKPRFGIVVQNPYDDKGVSYREKPFNRVAMEVGDTEGLGVLLQAAQYVIYKRGNFGDWAEFAEVFGMPFRWATYNNETSRTVLEEALSKAGSAGYAVVPADAQLQMQANGGTGTSNDIFLELRKACNEEIAITILGNTMTMVEAAHSGYAQSETHGDQQEELHKADRKYVLRVLNEKLNPYLASIGYDVAGGEWAFDDGDGMSLNARVDVDIKVASQVPVADDYWYEKYQIPRPTASQLRALEDRKARNKEMAVPASGRGKQAKPATPVEEDDDEGEGEGASLRMTLRAHHHLCQCGRCSTISLAAGDEWGSDMVPVDFPTTEAFLRKLYRKELDASGIDEKMWSSYFTRLRSAIRAGAGQPGIGITYGPDWRFNLKLEENAAAFSAFKNHDQYRELQKLLLEEDGTLTTWSKFKKRAAPLVGQYNEDWLRAEFEVARSATRMGVKWQEIQRRKNLYPNLEYITQRDARVRDTHRQLDRIIRPVDDPFWDTHYPPNGWRCRCDVRQTDDDPNYQRDQNAVTPDTGWSQNVGKTGNIFDPDHTYYIEDHQVRTNAVSRANFLWDKQTGKEVLDHYKALPEKPVITIPDLNKQVVVTNQAVRSVLNHYHPQGAYRNHLMYILPEVFEKMVFIQSVPESKGRANFKRWYYYLLELDDLMFKVQFVETASAEVKLYAITAP